jgi:hypothetical protein
MEDFDFEVLKQDLNIIDEMAKFQYTIEAWGLVYGCMVSESCFDKNGEINDKTEDIELSNLINLIEELATHKWGEAAKPILEIYGLKTTSDIKEIWDGYIRAGVLVDTGKEDLYQIRELMEAK